MAAKLNQPWSGKDRHAKRRSSARRRGAACCCLVVLSMLVLFMLIGTAFMMSSSQTRSSANASAKKDRVGNLGTRLLDRALLQVIRDTENPDSAIRYHSLLRDVYGTQGFQGVVYSPETLNLATALGQVSRFAGGTADVLATPVREELGPTSGQFIDIYVRQLAWDGTTNASLDDPFTSVTEHNGVTKLTQPDSRHIVKLDQNVLGQAQLYAMPLTKGYFNGCLLTMTSGAAAGQTARIVDYEHVADIAPLSGSPTGTTYYPTRLLRFRVMAFQRKDGQPLQINPDPQRTPEIRDLAGASFVVNGRAFGGTGAGYNPMAVVGQPKLSCASIVLPERHRSNWRRTRAPAERGLLQPA